MRNVIAAISLLLGTLLFRPTTGWAQDGGSGRIDTTEVLVVSRGLDSIRADRERIGRFRGEADGRYSNARARLAETETQVELFEKEIDAINEKIKVAKKAKQEAEKTVLDADKKTLERRKTLVERRRDLRRAEVELGQAELDYSEEAIRALDFEQQLERKRQDQADRALLIELERKTLEAKVEQESRRKSLADRRGRVVERQLSVMEAQEVFFKR